MISFVDNKYDTYGDDKNMMYQNEVKIKQPIIN